MGGGVLHSQRLQSKVTPLQKKKTIEMLNHRRLSAAGPAGPVADLQSYAGRHCCYETPGKEKKKKNPQTCCHKCDASKLLRTSEWQHPHHGRTDAGETEAVKSGKALKAPRAAASAGRHTTTATTTTSTAAAGTESDCYSLPLHDFSRDLMLISKKPESCWLAMAAASC